MSDEGRVTNDDCACGWVGMRGIVPLFVYVRVYAEDQDQDSDPGYRDLHPGRIVNLGKDGQSTTLPPGIEGSRGVDMDGIACATRKE